MGSVSNDEFNTPRDDLHSFGLQSGNKEKAQLTTVGRDRDVMVRRIGCKEQMKAGMKKELDHTANRSRLAIR